ncbi:AbrB/MazE/SpoVT family DNA-binding domain-containing protein [Acidaminobacter sp.]|jgi:transcriptional pleiotropic regulator of transition state genes|uniref:AbrB/MazE/SpoVT family DNA-binding domain-containing protein n=1 Tax=Acidaminobacter sp. TaxID=1872102 RepID=UPI003FA499A1
MKSTAIIRQVDELGQVALPIELRKLFDISNKDYLEIFIENDTMTLKKYIHHCSHCHGSGDLIKIKGKLICRDCILLFKEAGI